MQEKIMNEVENIVAINRGNCWLLATSIFVTMFSKVVSLFTVIIPSFIEIFLLLNVSKVVCCRFAVCGKGEN